VPRPDDPFPGTEPGGWPVPCWQAEATYPGGRTFIFGVQAPDLPQAMIAARAQADQISTAGYLTVTRLPPGEPEE
jgi:hypothetical protein